MAQTPFKWSRKSFGDAVKGTLSRLRGFKVKLAKKWIRKAANEASKVHLKTLKTTAPAKHKDWGSGWWKKSLGRKVKVFKSPHVVAWWAVGPRSQKFGFVQPKYQWFRYRGPHDKPADDTKYAAKKRKYKQNKHGFKAGKIYRIPITENTPIRFRNKKVWPVKFSHLLERRHHVIARANARAQAGIYGAITSTLTQAMTDV